MPIIRRRKRSVQWQNIQYMWWSSSSGEFVYWAAEEIARNPTERINNIEFQYERNFHPNVANAVMATSYALLLYLENNDHTGSVPIMKWIFSQHNRLMGWSSTQVI